MSSHQLPDLSQRAHPGVPAEQILLNCIGLLGELHFRRMSMLSWAIGFFIVAIIAAVFGFGGIAAGAAGIAKVLFFLFVVAFLVSLVVGLAKGRGTRL